MTMCKVCGIRLAHPLSSTTRCDDCRVAGRYSIWGGVPRSPGALLLQLGTAARLGWRARHRAVMTRLEERLREARWLGSRSSTAHITARLFKVLGMENPYGERR